MPEIYSAHHNFGFDRDFTGYGEKGLNPKWPNNAKIAVSFVINHKEGGERSVMTGDGQSEQALRENPTGPPRINERNYNVESEYEYGSRAGFWRLFRLFQKYKMKFTLYGVAQVVEQQPGVAKRCVEEGHVLLASRNSPQSRVLVPQVYEEMGEELVWASDTYADDVPYWIDPPFEKERPNPKGMLMVPYSYDCNDFKFHTAGSGFRDPRDFYEHIKGAFDVLYEEGCEGVPNMMTIGLYCRIVGRPGRAKAVRDFVD
ncbi:hypothetical protein MKZ38_002378 [Zalerion maritima]|uniref:Uncharacterized protein n=1 Tax=Zalerion maritima TaxID=339359 RepID=A0AAD5RYR8_9PEZI|nr:hypothetical protein MKZ38_002378 [Zalerion maritima]